MTHNKFCLLQNNLGLTIVEQTIHMLFKACPAWRNVWHLMSFVDANRLSYITSLLMKSQVRTFFEEKRWSGISCLLHMRKNGQLLCPESWPLKVHYICPNILLVTSFPHLGHATACLQLTRSLPLSRHCVFSDSRVRKQRAWHCTVTCACLVITAVNFTNSLMTSFNVVRTVATSMILCQVFVQIRCTRT